MYFQSLQCFSVVRSFSQSSFQFLLISDVSYGILHFNKIGVALPVRSNIGEKSQHGIVVLSRDGIDFMVIDIGHTPRSCQERPPLWYEQYHPDNRSGRVLGRPVHHPKFQAGEIR